MNIDDEQVLSGTLREILMRLRIAAISLLCLLSPEVVAAEPPDMVGKWTATDDRATVRVGTSPNAEPDPEVSTDGAAWTLDIQKQEGRVFYGVATGALGKPINVIGAFRNDGKRFTLATDNGSGDAEMIGDDFELCWADTLPTLVAIDCAVYSR